MAEEAVKTPSEAAIQRLMAAVEADASLSKEVKVAVLDDLSERRLSTLDALLAVLEGEK